MNQSASSDDNLRCLLRNMTWPRKGRSDRVPFINFRWGIPRNTVPRVLLPEMETAARLILSHTQLLVFGGLDIT